MTSELAVVRAVLGDLRISLGAKDPATQAARAGGPLYTQRRGKGGLNESDPTPPYFLARPAPTPAAPASPFDSVERFFVDGWGTWQQLADAFGRLGWLDGWQVAKQDGAFNIRYGLIAEPARDAEPEATMEDGREMYHFANHYQALYVDLLGLSGPALAPPRARAP